MPESPYTAKDHTGKIGYAFDDRDFTWRRVTVTAPENVRRVPLFNMSGWAEVPETPVRFSDGHEALIPFIGFVWHAPTYMRNYVREPGEGEPCSCCLCTKENAND